MTTAELKKKIEEVKELEALIREAETEVETLKEELKAEMEKQKKEEMNVDRYVMRYKKVSSNKFDTKIFKNAMPDLYRIYTKPSISMRFTITG